MNGRELILSALRGEKTERPPWLPFVGVHGAQLAGVDATQYLKDPELIVAGMREARRRYQPDGLPVLFDLQVEAEILGCEMRWAADGPPSVCSHPLVGGSLDALPEYSTEKGRFPLIKQVLDTVRPEMDDVALYGLITGPFTLALHLMGNDIFLQMYMEPDSVKQVLSYCTEVAQKTASFYIENGCDVVAVVDPMTSQISPDHFNEFVAGGLNAIFDTIREQGALSSLFVCGNATRNLEAMCQTRCDNISIDENIDLAALRELALKHGKSFGGNLKLTLVLLLGDEADARQDTVRCVDTGGDTGFVLAPGCDLPMATPPANLEAVAQLVHDEYQLEVARKTAEVSKMQIEEVELPDYPNEPRVTIDVITLDSASCAPCQYMVEAVEKAAARVESPVVVREHKVTTRAGIGAMCQLKVENIPTICIDGEARFVSIIPDQDTLVRAMEKAAEKKSTGAEV